MPTRRTSTDRLGAALLIGLAGVALPGAAQAQFGAQLGGAAMHATSSAGQSQALPSAPAVTVQGGRAGGAPVDPEALQLMRELEQNQRQRALLQGQIDLLELRNRLADAERRNANADGRPAANQAAQQDDPRVLRVRGMGSNMEATFMLSNGGVASGRVGDVVGGWRIVSIDISGVIAASSEGASATRKRLGFVGDSIPGLGTGPGGGGSMVVPPSPQLVLPMASPVGMPSSAPPAPPAPPPLGGAPPGAPAGVSAPGGSPSGIPGLGGLGGAPGLSSIPGAGPATGNR